MAGNMELKPGGRSVRNMKSIFLSDLGLCGLVSDPLEKSTQKRSSLVALKFQDVYYAAVRR